MKAFASPVWPCSSKKLNHSPILCEVSSSPILPEGWQQLFKAVQSSGVWAKSCWAELLLLSRFSHVQLWVTHRWQPTRLPHPWDYPGKNNGVACHFLLQCMKVKNESEVAQSCPTLSDPIDCSLPGSSIHGIFQARVLKRVANAFSRAELNIPIAKPV